MMDILNSCGFNVSVDNLTFLCNIEHLDMKHLQQISSYAKHYIKLDEDLLCLELRCKDLQKLSDTIIHLAKLETFFKPNKNDLYDFPDVLLRRTLVPGVGALFLEQGDTNLVEIKTSESFCQQHKDYFKSSDTVFDIVLKRKWQ